jgi:hypothetical protein
VTIASHAVFMWVCTFLVAGLSGGWFVLDVFRLRQVLREGPASVAFHDRVFGSIIGLICGVIGVTGAVLYHLR